MVLIRGKKKNIFSFCSGGVDILHFTHIYPGLEMIIMKTAPRDVCGLLRETWTVFLERRVTVTCFWHDLEKIIISNKLGSQKSISQILSE